MRRERVELARRSLPSPRQKRFANHPPQRTAAWSFPWSADNGRNNCPGNPKPP
jgi:hypothetical protein